MSLEIWAGVECTVNRIDETYSDQLERSGHAVRIKDLERLADLGVRRLRYPILWERTAPSDPESYDWSWSDERLDQLQQLDVAPIVGLLHHGSGPHYTNLLDPQFPEKLATYAGAVARRYPFVTDYTPVNEPLTTARFSCLYGHWFPHKRDPLLFAKALLNQCRATLLAMRAIREINPAAKLIQTEDLGKTFSTPTLAYQAEFENERRWLTFDILCGRLLPDSPMWEYFRWLGIAEAELHWFLENQTPPEVLGVNHYVTSERFLDERTTRYPAPFHGGNGRHVYADVEAVRVCAAGVAGPAEILREAWERYRFPLAVTEIHLGCTREEQLRWFKEVWTAANELRSQQVDIRAVTAWATFGAFDWNSLLTCESGCYEPGVFDLRSRATAHGVGHPDQNSRQRRVIRSSGTRHTRLVAPFGSF
jgi:dTDP-4-dehydrorhamnose reductase